MHKCRLCDSNNIESIIPLGNLPLANALLQPGSQQSETKHNLEVMLCLQCGIAQLKDLIDPKDLFTEYVYFSSNSTEMLHSAERLVTSLIPTLPKNALVIEIASNDGYLLKNYVAAGVESLGIDPATNIARAANERGIPTICEFFSKELAMELSKQGKSADIIHANNVMAHVPNINDFISGLKVLLKPTGTAIIEVPHLLELVQHLEFDTIYHEHVYYFTVRTLRQAFERHGLRIIDVERINIHGGSLRLFVRHAEESSPSPAVNEIIKLEENANLHDPSCYKPFMKRLKNLKIMLTQTLMDLKSNKARIAAYGASAKGTTLLNYFDIGHELIEYVVDKSTIKQGFITPGKHLSIYPPSKLLDDNIPYALLLTWNFANEIIAEQSEYIANGGRFIIPLPDIAVVP